MNTPDLAPKDGDFVAYIEQLERAKLRTPGASPGITSTAAMPKPAAPGATAAPTVSPAALAATSNAINLIPVGLFAIGLVLLVIGTQFNGGVILVFFGLIALWQAVRVLLRNLRVASESTRTQAAQQVTTLLAAHAQSKKQPTK